jgi:thiol:disulfide interchange protein
MKIAQGLMSVEEFLEFLSTGTAFGGFDVASVSFWGALSAAMIGGFLLNLTPCVLPMLPVNMIIIGNSFRRGALYALGITLAYGVLGVLAAFGGVVFGTIQSAWWFNAAISILFFFLALSLLGVWRIDFSSWRGRFGSSGPFLMGAVSALLSGACVAPVIIATLMITADMVSRGDYYGVLLPFAMGGGMASVWIVAPAGFRVWPKSGPWMKWVNRAFAMVIMAFAFYYGSLVFGKDAPQSRGVRDHGLLSAIKMTPDNFSLSGLERPVLIDCWASWCKSCGEMDRRISSSKLIREKLKRYTFVKLQIENVADLKTLPEYFHSLYGFPAFIIVDE